MPQVTASFNIGDLDLSTTVHALKPLAAKFQRATKQSAYCVFVKEFLTGKSADDSQKTRMRRAADAWKALTDEEKEVFERACSLPFGLATYKATFLRFLRCMLKSRKWLNKRPPRHR